MAVFDHRARIPAPGASPTEWSLRIQAECPDDDGRTPEEMRLDLLNALREYVCAVEASDWQTDTSILSRNAAASAKPVEAPFHMPVANRPPRPPVRHRPSEELSLETVKACHRLVEAVFLLGVHGRTVTTGDVVKSRRLAQRTLYRLLDPDGEAWSYLKPHLLVMQAGHRRILDLTPEGRLLASHVRAKTVPV